MELGEFISINGCDSIKAFNDDEKHEFLELLKLYKLFLRDELDIDNNITFGFEFEFSTLNPKVIESLIKTYTFKSLLNGRNFDNGFWFFKEETTVKNGYEVSSPILKDTFDTWKQVCEISDILTNNSASVGKDTAGHIHIGTQILGDNKTHWHNFMKLYTAYENIFFRFSYGEFEKERDSLSKYSKPLGNIYYKHLEDIKKHNYTPSVEEIIKRMSCGYKKYALEIHKPQKSDTSFDFGKTIEFRSFNASLEPIIWQNNLNFLVHFLQYAKSSNFDEDTVNKRIQNRKNHYLYNEIDVDAAFELADMIFDNNLDKINFLRQYLKSFITVDDFKTTDFIKRLK